MRSGGFRLDILNHQSRSPIVVAGYRLQELDPAKGTKIGNHQIGHHRIPKSLNVFDELAIFSAANQYPAEIRLNWMQVMV
jgi:hypothetical protein